MRNLMLLFSTALALTAASDDRWKFDEHQSVNKTFNVTTAGSGNAKLLVDNITRSVHVTGYAGREVKISADMRFRAESAEALAEAKRDVKLDMNNQGDFARIYLDDPFRDHNNRGERYYGYTVSVDFEIQVLTNIEVILKTVNGGPVILKNTSSAFDVRNVTGTILMEQVSGSGSVSAVNGSVTVAFSRNPTQATSFRTVNGEMDVYFQPPLAAGMSFKTVNGQVYTDFDVTPTPEKAGEVESKNGKFIYRSNRLTRGRAGQGGPDIAFETVNGNIRLHSKREGK